MAIQNEKRLETNRNQRFLPPGPTQDSSIETYQNKTTEVKVPVKPIPFTWDYEQQKTFDTIINRLNNTFHHQHQRRLIEHRQWPAVMSK